MTHELLANGSGVGHTLVLFSDQLTQAVELISAFEHAHYRAITVTSVAELNALEHEGAAYVVCDVDPERLLPVLQALRTNPRWRETAALVREERISDLAALAGVCPDYRALICHHENLLTLLKHHAQQLPSPEKRHLI